jgi:hypothetical protein
MNPKIKANPARLERDLPLLGIVALKKIMRLWRCAPKGISINYVLGF